MHQCKLDLYQTHKNTNFVDRCATPNIGKHETYSVKYTCSKCIRRREGCVVALGPALWEQKMYNNAIN